MMSELCDVPGCGKQMLRKNIDEHGRLFWKIHKQLYEENKDSISFSLCRNLPSFLSKKERKDKNKWRENLLFNLSIFSFSIFQKQRKSPSPFSFPFFKKKKVSEKKKKN